MIKGIVRVMIPLHHYTAMFSFYCLLRCNIEAYNSKRVVFII